MAAYLGFLDRCIWIASASGSGSYVYAAAVTGYQSPATAGAVDQQTYDYAAQSVDLTQWEYGSGVWTAGTTTLARTTIRGNMVGGSSAVSFNTVPQVIMTMSAAQALRTPTTQSLTSGSTATYSTPAYAKWLEVFYVGGGGGGGGCSASATVAGSSGGVSIFNAINANGGSGASGVLTAQAGGAGGTGGTGSATRRQPGSPGSPGTTSGGGTDINGTGGTSYFGGGAVGATGTATVVGNSAAANTGGGGGGATNTTNPANGGGGGGGEFAYLLITNPVATYTYTVGTSGAGGVSTTNGGAGGTGFIFVIEHYD